MNEVSPKYNVLLIEDDDRLAQLIAEYLDGYEFAVTIVRRGDTAVAAIREHKPALVILDLMLPNMDGMEVCRRIRGFSSVPVLSSTRLRDLKPVRMTMSSSRSNRVCWWRAHGRCAGARSRLRKS
jgi:two-component system OmpR family response regulator